MSLNKIRPIVAVSCIALTLALPVQSQACWLTSCFCHAPAPAPGCAGRAASELRSANGLSHSLHARRGDELSTDRVDRSLQRLPGDIVGAGDDLRSEADGRSLYDLPAGDHHDLHAAGRAGLLALRDGSLRRSADGGLLCASRSRCSRAELRL